MKNTSPKYAWFAYYIPRRGKSALPIQYLRDGATFAQISDIMQKGGFENGPIIFNWPLDKTKRDMRVNSPFLTGEDIIVLTTRPPLHDNGNYIRKIVKKSESELENYILNGINQVFETCTRDQVWLTEEWAAKLIPDFSDRAAILYRQNGGAKILDHQSYQNRHLLRNHGHRKFNKTMFYIIYIPHLWNNGPGLFCSFGMSGREALIGSYLLRTKYWDKLGFTFDKQRLAMLEINFGDIPMYPQTIDFVKDWKVEVPLNASLN